MKLPFNIHLNLFTPWVYFHVGRVGAFHIQIGHNSGFTASLNTGGDRFLAYRVGADFDEVTVWEFMGLIYTRPENEEERLDREEADMEAAFMEREANRYTEWSY